MSGLEKIVERITRENDEQCRALLENAEKKAQGVLEKARADGNEQAAVVIDKANSQASRILSMAHSSAAMEAKSALLSTRVQLINEVVEKALCQIDALPDGEYFDIIKKLAVANSGSGKGEMLLSGRDLARLPEAFEKELNVLLSDGKEIAVSSQPAAISDGFILRYGDIEENCTFEAIASSRMDELKAVASEKLFN